METNPEIRESLIKKNVWNEMLKNMLIAMWILFAVFVTVWKYHLIYNAIIIFDFRTIAKIYAIAVGTGTFFAYTIMCFVTINLKKEKKTKNYEINALLTSIEDISSEIDDPEELQNDDFKKLSREKKIARIEDIKYKIAVLEMEYLMLETETETELALEKEAQT